MGCSLLSTFALATMLVAGAGCAEKQEQAFTNAEPVTQTAPAPAESAEPAEPAAPSDDSAGTADETAEPNARAGNGDGGVQLTSIGNFNNPVHIGFAKRYPGRTYVVEQRGVIRVLKGGRLQSQPFLDIRGRVRTGGEQGLLSVAFHPKKKQGRRFYVYYVNRSGDIQVDEFRMRTPDRANRSSRRMVIRIPHRYADNHNGGQLQFGPDKHLYIGTGDGGGGGDPEGNGQNRRTLLGALLRINPLKKKRRGRPNLRYRIPKGNPFKGRSNGRNELYAIGLRNPFRFSFDRRTGRIAIGDVGQNKWEEVNIETRRSLRGANFGWNRFEGREVFDSSTGTPANSNHSKPVFVYANGGGNCSITGGYIVRDNRLPTLFGRYLYADFCRGELRSFRPNRPSATGDRPLGPIIDSPSSFGESPRGHIYAASLSGPVYRLDPQ